MKLVIYPVKAYIKCECGTSSYSMDHCQACRQKYPKNLLRTRNFINKMRDPDAKARGWGWHEWDDV